MNKQTITGRWTQLKGAVLEQWGRLRRDGRLIAAGRREQALGRISAAQGAASAQAEHQLRDWQVRHAAYFAQRKQSRSAYN